MPTKTVLLVNPTTSWVVPADLDPNQLHQVICIGSGAGGGMTANSTANVKGAGGGAAWSSSNLNLLPGVTAFVSIPTGGAGASVAGNNGAAGGDCWFNWNSASRTSSNAAPVSNATGVLAKGGGAGSGTTGGAGGAAAS